MYQRFLVFAGLMTTLTSTVMAVDNATFSHVRPANGQRIRQEVQTDSQLHTTFTQSNQLISSEPKNIVINQVRNVVVVEADPNLIAKVQVTYAKATRKAAGKLLNRSKPQPVAGKTYNVSRVEDELVVLYADGTKPPADELLIVDANMQSVGKTNPVAKFLAGRTVAIGEQLTMPAELASDLLGSSMVKEAESVTLKLLGLKGIDNQAAGVFATSILGAVDDQQQRSFDCQGTIAISVATCRTLRLDMKAKVAIREERGPTIAPFQVANEGQVEINMAAYYTP